MIIKKQKEIFFIIILITIVLHLLRTVVDRQDLEWATTSDISKRIFEHQDYQIIEDQILSKPLFLGPDSYYWVLYAKQMVEENKIRIRYTHFDNVPFGREVAWHSGYSWYLIGLGKIDSFLTGKSLSSGIENSSRYSNPILMLLFALLFAFIFYHHFNPLLAAVIPASILFLFAICSTGPYGRVDHHLLHAMMFMGQVICIIVGGGGLVAEKYKAEKLTNYIFTAPDYKNAKKWFTVAAVFGGLGLWIGATQQAVLIGCLGAAGCISYLLFFSTQNDSHLTSFEPRVWRIWGIVGCTLSILFYLVEYFPDHMGMRLEVNHPLYALAWLGGAEFIYRLCTIVSNKNERDKIKTHSVWMVISLSGVLLIVVLVLFGPPSWHSLHDSVMRRTHEIIQEFKSPFGSGSEMRFTDFVAYFGLFPITVLLSAIVLTSKKINIYHKHLTILSLLPTIVLICFFSLQIRWHDFLGVIIVLHALIIISSFISIGTNKYISQMLAVGPCCYFCYQDATMLIFTVNGILEKGQIE